MERCFCGLENLFSFSSVVTGERHLSIQNVIKPSKHVKKKYSDIKIIRYLIVSLQKNFFSPLRETYRISISAKPTLTKYVLLGDRPLITRDFLPTLLCMYRKISTLKLFINTYMYTYYA